MVFVLFVGKKTETRFLALALVAVCFLSIIFSTDLLRSQAFRSEEEGRGAYSSESALDVPGLKDGWNRTQQTRNSTGSVVQNEEKVSLVVGLKETFHADVSAVAEIADAHAGKIIDAVLSGEGRCAVVVEVSASSVSYFTEDLHQAGLASYVEPRGKSRTQFWPDDSYFAAQWGSQKIEVDWAWNVSVGNRNVLVAVLDTGIDWLQPDLVSNYVPLGYDWVNDDADPMDDYGHGTHCAGTIAATMNNSQGIAGMAQVRIMAEKVLNNRGEGYSDWIANGIYHAVLQGARVISMSFGDYDGSEVVHEALKFASSAGVLLTACAGNDNTERKFYPAAYPEVIAVAATNSDDVKASFSNFGDWVELAAPGVGVLSTLLNNDYQSYSGTSVACPFVSGLCALIISAFPNSTASFVRYLLRYSADDLGASGLDKYYGYGRINARKALSSPSAEREIVVSDLVTPPFLTPGVTSNLVAEIFNLGRENEDSIEIQFFANDSLVWNRKLAPMTSYGIVTVNVDWMPTLEGTYNITLYAVPLPGETILGNNAVMKFIYVGPAVKAAVLRCSSSLNEDVLRNWNSLNSEWQQFGSRLVYVDYMSLNKPHITYLDLVSTQADVLVITNAHTVEFDNVELSAIEQYVYEGHGLILTGNSFSWDVPNNRRLLGFTGLDRDLSMGWFFNKTDLVRVLDTSHPLFSRVPTPIVLPLVASTVPSPSAQWGSAQLAEGTYLGFGYFNDSVIVEFRGLLYFSFLIETIPTQYHHHLQLLYNGILYARYEKPEHQLKVTLDSPRYLKPKQSALLNATVYNWGQKNETDVQLSLSMEGTNANSILVRELPAGASRSISFLFEPAFEGQYRVEAYAPAVAGEEQTEDNNATMVVTAHYERWVLWDMTHANPSAGSTEYLTVSHQLLKNDGFTVHDSNDSVLSSELLLGYDILVLIAPRRDFSSNEIADVLEWMHQGGSLLVVVDPGFTGTLRYLTLPSGIQIYRGSSGRTVATGLIKHPITDGVGSLYTVSGQRLEASSPSQEIAWIQNGDLHYGLVCASEDKEIVVISDKNLITNAGIFRYGNERLFMNVFHWLAVRHAYEHDVATALGAPVFVQRGQSAIISASVRNKGSEDETDVKACLWINEQPVQLMDIPRLQSGEACIFEYVWSPIAEADFNASLYVDAVDGENFTANNLATTIIPVFYYERHYFANWWAESGFAMDWHGNGQIWTYTLPFNFPLFNHLYRTILVSEDGLITFAVANRSQSISSRTLEGLLAIAPAWHDWSTIGDNDIFIEQPDLSHVLIRWKVMDSSSVAASFIVELGADGVIQFSYGFSNQSAATVIGISNGEGYMLVENVEDTNNLKTVVFTPFELEHEIAVTLQAPNSISMGRSVLLNATLTNLGLANESGIILQLSINESIVESLTLSELNRGALNLTNYLWTPPTLGKYDLKLCALPVSGEVYTKDNTDQRTVFVVENATTYVSVEPRTMRVEIGKEFTVQIYVNSVANLYTWQIKLYYDNTIFQCVEAWLPSHNVFAYGIPLVPPPMIEGNYTLVGATLMGNEWPFTGCGTLCKIRFKAIKNGNCSMLFDEADTFLLTPSMKPMDHLSVSAYVETSMWLPDFNNDGIVDSADVALIAGAFGMTQSSQGWNPVFDANLDSKINMYDIAKAARALGTST